MAKRATNGKSGSKKPVNGPRKAAPDKVSKKSGDLDIEQVERLMHLMAQNGVLELEVQDGSDRRVRLSRRPPETPTMILPSAAMGTHGSASGSVHPTHHAPPPQPTAPKDAGPPPGTIEFCSPMVGTFYRASNPESAPYCVPGDRVQPETVVCIIEAMKVMNEIKAELSGEIVDVLVENGEAVEYGQPLFLIKKSG
jgi:acetyl-CoA carboxylase biotin carboxyl carrier protein